MANHHSAQDYTADGPTNVGFRTGGDNTNIKNGVVAHGTEIGVHGIGDLLDGTTATSVGVKGEGWIGVHGQGTPGNGLGVLGDGDSTGVWGRGQLIGVHGESSGDQDGTGVQGNSVAGTGVQGISESSVGVDGRSQKSVGVNGHSERGSGIRGSSDGSYGGVFKSNFAQIRLHPADEWFGPPKTESHQIGEFFVDKRGALFYCMGGSPPQWQQLAGPSLFKNFATAVRNIFSYITRK